MLDDLKYIHQRDGQDALGIAEKQWQQLEYEFQIEPLSGEFENIVYAGMGGSALAALLSLSWPGYKVPFILCRDYNIPKFVDHKTLFIAASYSGNTEETLEALSHAQKKQAKIAAIAGGGKLADQAKEFDLPMIRLPKAVQPRYAALYNLKAIIILLESTDLLAIPYAGSQAAEAAAFLREAVQAWLPTVPTEQNPAKKLAMELAGKSPAVYAGPFLAPAAYKWKINFNENAKNVAWWNEIPEFDHNELTGWSSHPVEKPYGIIELRSQFDHPRVQKRFEVGEKLLSGRRPAAYIVQAEGGSKLEQLLWSVAYGDFVSIYLGLLNGVDPAPVDLVEKFKKELG